MTCKDCMSYDTETGFCKTCGAAVGIDDPKCSAYTPEDFEEYRNTLLALGECEMLSRKVVNNEN